SSPRSASPLRLPSKVAVEAVSSSGSCLTSLALGYLRPPPRCRQVHLLAAPVRRLHPQLPAPPVQRAPRLAHPPRPAHPLPRRPPAPGPPPAPRTPATTSPRTARSAPASAGVAPAPPPA